MPDPNPKRKPYYLENDVTDVVNWNPFNFDRRLSGRHIHGTVAHLNATAQDCRRLFLHYDHVRYLPLEPFYRFRKAASMLDEELLCDLLYPNNRLAYYGAWFAALAPRPAYARHLDRCLEGSGDSTTAIRLALAACGHEVPPELKDTYAHLTEMRDLLNQLPALPAPMRRNWTAEQLAAARHEIRVARTAYHAGGYEGAKELLHHGIWGYFRMSHQQWLAAGAPAPPAVPPLPRARHKVVPRFR